MKFEEFELERNQSLFEHEVDYNLSESGLHPLPLKSILTEDEQQELLETELIYGYTTGTPMLREKIADMYTTMNACKSYVYNVAKSCDRGNITREDAAGVLLYSSEKAVWMSLETIQCLGGNGYINDYPTGRLLRDAKLYDIGAGTNEIRRMLIGREIFKKNSFNKEKLT